MIKKKTLKEFINQSNLIHNCIYDYSKSEYINSTTKIEIICSLHGSFFQQPRAHIMGQGCPICGSLRTGTSVKYTLEEFILEANKIHNNFYDYFKVEYKGSFTHIIIVCPKHGEFSQLPSNHLGGLGCQKCGRGSVSKSENKWLDSLNIPIEYRQTPLEINGQKYFVDALDPNTKTVYEFYGDYWHGNPEKCNPNQINKSRNKTFKELYDQTIGRENIIKKAGYNIISIWEADWKILYRQIQ